MSLTRLPSGRWRARVYHQGKKLPVAPILGLPDGHTWETKREATAARAKAREILLGSIPSETTVKQFWQRWTTDPLLQRPKESTNIHNRERTKAFAEKYGSLKLHLVTRQLVTQQWLANGQNHGTIPALRAMFNDAMSDDLIDRNPFARLGVSKGKGNADVQPPDQDTIWKLIRKAKEISYPSFSAWLQVAAFTGMRPGELDALRWENVDWEAGRIRVVEQFSAKTRTFTLPKNGRRRKAPLTPQAREALLEMQAHQDCEFCFSTMRRTHWTAASRAYHWKAVKAAVGYKGTLYLATRHFAGWYMINELNMQAEDVAAALGHTDGGYLVRTLYGHLDEDRALDRTVDAYSGRSNVVELKAVKEEAG